MRERWDEAINKIDEKYIAEAAETHAKHAAKQLEAEQFETEGERPTAVTAAPVKKSNRGRIIGICTAAAAVALMVIGGGIMLGRDDSILTGDTTTESTVEATTESGESIDHPEPSDRIIGFTGSYEEGYISFTAPGKSAWLGGNGVRGPISDWERQDVFYYVQDIADIDISCMDGNLIDNGYVLDLSDNKSYMNSLASAERQNRQITLSYTKGDAEILINLGESDDNFRYHFYGEEACRLDAAGTESYLVSIWTGEKAAISIGGMISADDCSYYAVDITGLEEDIYCSISARGCVTDDILDTLAGLVCDVTALNNRKAEPLDLSKYGAFATSRYNVDLPLSDYRVSELKAAVFELEEHEAVYDIGNCETLSAILKMYRSDTVDGHYEYLQLHKSANGSSLDEYYYSISDNNNTAYFRITEQHYNDIFGWFATNSPTYFDGKVLAEDDIGNTTRPAEGFYLIEHDGGVIMLDDENIFAVGDTVRVWFDGLIMESYPEQVNKIKIEKIYPMSEDESPLVPEGEQTGGFDADIYEEHFLGRWGVRDAMDYTAVFDYNSGTDDHISCGELSDGYYFSCYSGGQPEFCFIHKESPDIMYLYSADLQNPQNTKRNQYVDDFYRKADIGNTLYGELNMMGEAELADRMGQNFAEVLQGLKDGYTLNDTFWVFGLGYAGTPNDPKIYLKDYSSGTNAYYAEIYMQYYNADTLSQYDDDEVVLQWYSHFITLTDNGYEVVATLPCDKNGNVAPDAEGRNFTSDDLYGHDVTAVFSWAGTGDYIAYPQVYVEDTNTRRVLAQTHIQNPSMWSYGGYILQGFDVKVMDVRLNGGAVFAVMIPVSYNPGPDATGYEVTFYWYDKPNKELHLVGEADGGFFPICVNEGITTEPENNLVKIDWTDGSVHTFRFDFTDDGVNVTDSEARDDVIYVDLSKGNASGPDFSVWANVFAGKWESSSHMWELDLNSHDFGYNDPCRFYSDENGFFMLAENRVWYVPADDHEQMFYFEKVKQSGELSLSEFHGRYTRAEPFQGFSMGEGEMGWFGLLYLLYDSEGDGVTADQLLHLEITDENGNVWTRGGDKNIDWSGMYCAEIDGNSVIFLLMQSKAHPETFQRFSFDIDMDAAGEGVLKYSDEHYTFNMWITDTSVLSTDYATAIKTDVESSEHGKFTMRTMFYPMEDGSYYAIRMMGNDQAQWITDGELFYNSRDYDGVEGYEKLSEDIGISICMSDENVLYRLYNRYEEDMSTTLRLAAYSGGDQVCDIHVSNDGFLPMGGADASIIGTSEKYLFVQYHDTELMLDQYVLYDISDPASVTEMLRTDKCEQLADGSVRLTAQDGSVTHIT